MGILKGCAYPFKAHSDVDFEFRELLYSKSLSQELGAPFMLRAPPLNPKKYSKIIVFADFDTNLTIWVRGYVHRPCVVIFDTRSLCQQYTTSPTRAYQASGAEGFQGNSLGLFLSPISCQIARNGIL